MLVNINFCGLSSSILYNRMTLQQLIKSYSFHGFLSALIFSKNQSQDHSTSFKSEADTLVMIILLGCSYYEYKYKVITTSIMRWGNKRLKFIPKTVNSQLPMNSTAMIRACLIGKWTPMH